MKDIRMMAVPALTVTHDDKEPWNAAAAVKKLPGMSPGGYRRLSGRGKERHHQAGGTARRRHAGQRSGK